MDTLVEAEQIQPDQDFAKLQEKRRLAEKGQALIPGTRDAYTCTGKDYCNSFNLKEELHGLKPHDVVLDLGCGTGVGASELHRDFFPKLDIVGVNNPELPVPPDKSVDIPIACYNIQDLDHIRRALEKESKWPPQVVLMRNVAHYLDTDGLLPDALQSWMEVLPADGKMLIYYRHERESGEDQPRRLKLYEHIEEITSNNQNKWEMSTHTSRQDPHEKYIRLSKPSKPPHQ